MRLLIFLILGALPSALVAGATKFSETEPNGDKLHATAVSLVNNDYVVGWCGFGTNTARVWDDDYFKIVVPPQTQFASGQTVTSYGMPNIYRYRLTCSSQQAVIRIRGKNQTDGVIGSQDVVVQESLLSTTPANFVQWYGFGYANSAILVSVSGRTDTKLIDYVLRLSVQKVNDIAAFTYTSNDFSSLNATVRTSSGDTDMWWFTGTVGHYGGEPPTGYVSGSGRDGSYFQYTGSDGAQHTGTSNTAKATFALASSSPYVIAVSNRNLATSGASPPEDPTRSGNVLDYENAIACSVSSPPAFTVSIDVTGTRATDGRVMSMPAPAGSPFSSLSGPFDVLWLNLREWHAGDPARACRKLAPSSDPFASLLPDALRQELNPEHR